MTVLMKDAKPGACPCTAESDSFCLGDGPTGSIDFNGDVHQEAGNCEERTIYTTPLNFPVRFADEFGRGIIPKIALLSTKATPRPRSSWIDLLLSRLCDGSE